MGAIAAPDDICSNFSVVSGTRATHPWNEYLGFASWGNNRRLKRSACRDHWSLFPFHQDEIFKFQSYTNQNEGQQFYNRSKKKRRLNANQTRNQEAAIRKEETWYDVNRIQGIQDDTQKCGRVSTPCAGKFQRQ